MFRTHIGISLTAMLTLQIHAGNRNKTEKVQAQSATIENANDGELAENNTKQDRPKGVREADKTSKSVETQISASSDPRASFGVPIKCLK